MLLTLFRLKYGENLSEIIVVPGLTKFCTCKSSHQDFSCPVRYVECQSSSSASLDHTENPCALTDPPVVVLAFVAKHGLVDLDHLEFSKNRCVAASDHEVP